MHSSSSSAAGLPEVPAELPDLGIGDYTVTPLSTKTEQVTEAEALGAGPPLHPPRPLLI